MGVARERRNGANIQLSYYYYQAGWALHRKIASGNRDSPGAHSITLGGDDGPPIRADPSVFSMSFSLLHNYYLGLSCVRPSCGPLFHFCAVSVVYMSVSDKKNSWPSKKLITLGIGTLIDGIIQIIRQHSGVLLCAHELQRRQNTTCASPLLWAGFHLRGSNRCPDIALCTRYEPRTPSFSMERIRLYGAWLHNATVSSRCLYMILGASALVYSPFQGPNTYGSVVVSGPAPYWLM